MTRRYSFLRRRAVTLTELLVVLLIVGLLATIALPVYLTKVQQAKIVAARQEVRELAHAEEHCLFLHGFYVPLQMLDDLIYDANLHRPVGRGATDDLLNENQQIYLIDPFKIVLHSTTAPVRFEDKQPQLQDRQNPNSPYRARLESLYLYWGGPFINFHRDFVQQQIRQTQPSAANIDESFDFPLDPWGQPYRFYTPLGLAGDTATSVNPENWDEYFSNGHLFYAGRPNTDRFDRYAVVSFGPDSLADNRTDPYSGSETTGDNRNDDIFYLFGGFFNESSFRVFY